jgi:hypothetical protein
MTLSQILQTAIVLLGAATPWLVVAIAHAQARAHVRNSSAALASTRPARRRLTVATVVASLPLAVLALRVTPPSGRLAIATVAAVVVLLSLGMAALRAIDRATAAEREIAATTRVASLRPRRFDAVVPSGPRWLSYGVTILGALGAVYQILRPAPGQRLLVPISFALGAVVFLFLYEAWMRDEISGGRAEGEAEVDDIRRRVRRIQRLQLVLVTGLLLVANIVVGLDWTTRTSVCLLLTLGGAVLGVVGCAHALASGFTTRRYQAGTRCRS